MTTGVVAADWIKRIADEHRIWKRQRWVAVSRRPAGGVRARGSEARVRRSITDCCCGNPLCGNRPQGQRPIRGLPSTRETLLIFPIVTPFLTSTPPGCGSSAGASLMEYLI